MGLYLIESSQGISSFSTFEGGGALSKMQYPSDGRPLSSKKFPETTCRKFVNLAFVMPHSNVENEEIPGLLSIKPLPKYSPMLTMVENAISAWKQGIKRSLSIRMHEFTKPAPAVVAGRTLTQYRIDKMSEIIRETQGEVTIEKCRAWYDHTLTYILDCLEEKLVLG